MHRFDNDELRAIYSTLCCHAVTPAHESAFRKVKAEMEQRKAGGGTKLGSTLTEKYRQEVATVYGGD